ncbi:MAG: nucleotidyltransferase family protein [Thermodesulfovibrionales bacterium]
MKQLSPEMTIVLSMACLNPSDDIIESIDKMLQDRLDSIDYDTVFRLAAMGGVSGLLYNNFKKLSSVPKDFMHRLENYYFQIVRNNMLHVRETMRVLKLMRNEGIEVIPLKGSIAADMIFGNFGLYPTSDIDILVRRTDMDRVEEVLQKNGFTKTFDLKEKDLLAASYHVCYGNNKYVVEVHWNLVMRYFNVDSDFWWKDSTKMRYEDCEVEILSGEKYILYLIFRLYSHAFRPLRFSVLVSALIIAYSGKIDWRKLTDYSKTFKMNRLLIFTLRLMHDIHGNEIPVSMTNKRIWCYKFFKQFILSGFFTAVHSDRLRMLVLIFLQDTPLSIARVLMRRVFPSIGEVRWRYGLSSNSKKVYWYYIVNPILMLVKKR